MESKLERNTPYLTLELEKRRRRTANQELSALKRAVLFLISNKQPPEVILGCD